jgi:aryl-alcohol dehydrogenase-like predicted oxidoreductase
MRYLRVDTTTRISKIGLGTSQFGSQLWAYGESYAKREAYAIVRRALELGVTLFDTAEIYSAGRSERILGSAIGDDREPAFIATKLCPILPVSRTVRNHAVASAKRLGVSYLDLYQVHWPNPFISDDAVMRGMRALQDSALIDEVGVSGYDLERWRSAENALGGRVLTNQVEYNLVNRSPERGLLPFAESNGRAIIAFSPLAKGLLSGRYDGHNRPTDFRTTDPRFDSGYLDLIGDLLATLREVADAHSATPAQIALAWVIHHPAVAAIPGAASVAQLEENVTAAEIQLAHDEYRALQAASAQYFPHEYSFHRDLSAVKHLARCSKYVARTMLHDQRHMQRRWAVPRG